MLTTKEAVKLYLDIDDEVTKDDAFFDARIKAFTKYVQQRTGCSIVDTTVTRKYDGTGYSVLHLRDKPVQSVTTVHESLDHVFDASSLIDPSNYVLDGERGRIFRKGNVPWEKYIQNIQVVFVAGFVDVENEAADLVDIAIRSVARQWLRRKEGGVTLKVSGSETKVNVPMRDITKDELKVIDSYCYRPFVA